MLRLVPAHQKQKLQKVSAAIYGLALVYVLMVVWYVGFEKVIINYRPVLLDGALEASYPSSHTMMVVTILWTGILAFKTIFPEHQKLCFWITVLSAALITFTIAGRLVCGVHWFTDIIGALLFIGRYDLFVSLLARAQSQARSQNDIISV